MEITTLGFLFWFTMIMFAFFQIRSMRKEFLPAMFNGLFSMVGFLMLAMSFLTDITFIGFGSPSNPIVYSPDATLMYPQKAVAYMFLFLAFMIFIQLVASGLYYASQLYNKDGGTKTFV